MFHIQIIGNHPASLATSLATNCEVMAEEVLEVNREKLIKISFQNNKACVYSVADWEKLRREHRIVGIFLGNSLYTPTLPVALLPEEVCLLVNKNLAKLVRYPSLGEPPTQAHCEDYSKLQTDLVQAEQALYKKTRRDDLEQIIDKIIAGKKKKSSETELRTREEILEEELNKSCEFNASAVVWPIFTEPLGSVRGPPVDVPLSEILGQTTPTKCAVFADLWERGHYITSGFKFGGDFLVYLGEPIAYHAVYIVRCIEDPSQEHHTSEVVAFGRLGTSVKKKAVLASLSDDGSVSYITLSWLDK